MSEETQHWQDITAEAATVAVEAVPTVVDVAGQVSTLTDAHNDNATRIAALEKALFDVASFVATHLQPGHVNQPVVPTPAPASIVSKGS